MIRLKNVSKYYYNKGIISSGFIKLNAEFNIGEFVVITGESGSGKSTLLNVLSGLDTYEEGEMYINGEETSHYGESDFEEYRKKYISNIFQNFNLVNSYTVYQNIELVCLINGFKRKDVKNKVIELIKQVDLYRYRNTKVSKLSGGQKQRVAIARALAKDTPIIIADEPTGNLDKKSAVSVMKTLHELSKEKLVIIVTHNYEQAEEYATRKITMFDGKIIEDKKIHKTEEIEPTIKSFKNISRFNEIRLSLRNTFNIIPNFLLLLAVFLFMILAFTFEHASFASSKYESAKIGVNQFLENKSDKRIIISKKNKEPFSESDYEKISGLSNVDYIVKNDFSLDYSMFLTSSEAYLYGQPYLLEEMNKPLDYGQMPTNDNEIVIEGSKDNYYIDNYEMVLNKAFTIYGNNDYSLGRKVKAVGIIFNDNMDYDVKVYINKKAMENFNNSMILGNSETKIKINNQDVTLGITYLDSIPEGKVYIPSDYEYLCDYGYCINRKVNIRVSNLYFDHEVKLKVDKLINKNNCKNLTGLNSDEYFLYIYLSRADYIKLLTDEIYQSSVFVKDSKKVSETSKELDKLDLNVYAVSDMVINMDLNDLYILNIVNVIVTIILLVAMFFISYLIIKLILKSRHIYFTTLRILGANSKSLRRMLSLELITILNIAALIILTLIVLISKDYIVLDTIKELLSFMKIKDYVLVYLILLVMTYLISIRFARYIFKKSAMKQLGEEV